MAEQTIIVWDLETVLDIKAAARMLGLGAASEGHVRQVLGPTFPKHPLHQIACIGALVAIRRSEGWQIEALGAPHIGDRSEADLIAAFVERIGQLHPQLITYNGNTFDLPVLRYRAMVNRVASAGLQVRPYFHRYTDDALDLCDALASYTTNAKVSLDQLSKLLGLPGKPPGVDGGSVEAMVKSGRIDEVAKYCETDVLNTYRVWLIYELFRGTLTQAEFRWSENSIREFVLSRKMSNPYLIDGIRLSPTNRDA